jgi:hypothetical protein
VAVLNPVTDWKAWKRIKWMDERVKEGKGEDDAEDGRGVRGEEKGRGSSSSIKDTLQSGMCKGTRNSGRKQVQKPGRQNLKVF